MASGEPPNQASRSDLSRLRRQLQSRVIRLVIHPGGLALRRRAREAVRRLRGQPHRIDYFHEAGDPYSHLAAQTLGELARCYDVLIVPHLAAPAGWPESPEPELLASLGQRDCAAVAPHYGLGFPTADRAPSRSDVAQAEAVLSAALREDVGVFAERAVAVGEALWRGDGAAFSERVASLPRDDEAATTGRIEAGRALRAKLGHYSGATFHYAGEWYWGVDRLYHLERRLRALGAAREDGPPCYPRPSIAMEPVARAAGMTLEIFPSLRSPYTAIGLERTLEMVERTGIGHELRPVMPMVMRGVPVTMAKGQYIMSDTLREAEAMGMPFGRMLDPIGEPVRRAFSLWPWARKQGRGGAFLTSFLRAAFAEGVDTSTDAGLRRVVERAGLRWDEALPHLGDPAWEEELERHRLAMVEEMGQWGVPSFRLRGPAGSPDLCCWGQDRLWLVSRAIQERGRADGPTDPREEGAMP